VSETLREVYESFFDIRSQVDADPVLLAASYRLRYQVYCVEYGYEDRDDFPDGQERDRFDERSVHSLLIHRSTGLVAGTVRLIRPDPLAPHDSLPIDRLCRDPILHDEGVLARGSIAEVSRFAISKDFRKRLEDVPSPTGVGPQWHESGDERRRLPHLCVGLIQGLVYNSRLHGIGAWVAEMEPALLRMLRKLGIYFDNMGPRIEFHGKRQPCYTHLDRMLERTKVERPDIWALITMGGRLH
jgi:N-acyl amino acid synthase of PEP-CTERM/exosortase system